MAKGRFSEVWDGLPSWAKGVSVILGIGIVSVVGVTFYNGVKRKLDSGKAQKTVDNATQDLTKLEAGGINPSYIGSQYGQWADSIQALLDGCGSSDINAEQELLDIFGKMNNLADLLALISAFGVRTLHPCFVWHPIDAATGKTYDGDLAYWIHTNTNSVNVFAGSTIDKINTSLKDKNINYSF